MARLAFALAAVVAAVAADDTKRIKDPVVRHDAKQCGQYMCPAYPNAAEKYILDGCSGDFAEFASSTSLDVAGAGEIVAARGLSTSSFALVALGAGLVAVCVGFAAGRRGKRAAAGYLPVRTMKNPFDFDEVDARAPGAGYQ